MRRRRYRLLRDVRALFRLRRAERRLVAALRATPSPRPTILPKAPARPFTRPVILRGGPRDGERFHVTPNMNEIRFGRRDGTQDAYRPGVDAGWYYAGTCIAPPLGEPLVPDGWLKDLILGGASR